MQLKQIWGTIEPETGEEHDKVCRNRYHLYRTNPQVFLDTSPLRTKPDAKTLVEGTKTPAEVTKVLPNAGSKALTIPFTLNWGSMSDGAIVSNNVPGFAEASAVLEAVYYQDLTKLHIG
jgi:hypothetical protein